MSDSMAASAAQVRDVHVVVIGAGPTGENVAQYAHDGGLSVVLIEGELLGGECSYYACMPSKALLRPIEVAASARHLQGVSTLQIDPVGLMKRRDVWVSQYRDAGQLSWAESAGLEPVRGHAVLSGERQVTVRSQEQDGAGRVYRAAKAVV